LIIIIFFYKCYIYAFSFSRNRELLKEFSPSGLRAYVCQDGCLYLDQLRRTATAAHWPLDEDGVPSLCMHVCVCGGACGGACAVVRVRVRVQE